MASKGYADVILLGGPLDGQAMELCLAVDVTCDVFGGMSLDLSVDKIGQIEIRGHKYVRPRGAQPVGSDGWVRFYWDRLIAKKPGRR